MTTAALPARANPRARSETALIAAARLWFAVMAIGQAMFLYYIVVFYGPATLSGHFEGWARNANLITGYKAGDTVGNLSFGVHVMLAAVVTAAGLLQLVPQIRSRAPAVHRWIGRVFLAAAMAAAVAGLYGVWVRSASVDAANAIAITLNLVLILGMGGLAWRTAMRREFVSHRRWAMRTLLVVNGVFFLRIGIVAYGLIAKLVGPAIPGPEQFFDVWAFGCYLVPLAALEAYLFATAKAGSGARFAAAAGLGVLSALMTVGTAGAWFAFFAPVLAKL
ncbi:MAG: DUF2306 domain-containing protein [Caulobacterales bacterium]|nr:DUF2306 domain-containing protein [Caulobacterales bacterium]